MNIKLGILMTIIFISCKNENITVHELCGDSNDSMIDHYSLNGYYDYFQGVDCAKKLHKPILLMFDMHGRNPVQTILRKIYKQNKINDYISNNYVPIILHIDDRQLISNELFNYFLENFDFKSTSFNEESIKTIGNMNAFIQIEMFESNTQPLFTIITPNQQLLEETKGYFSGTSKQTDEFYLWLKSGVQHFEDGEFLKKIKPFQ